MEKPTSLLVELGLYQIRSRRPSGKYRWSCLLPFQSREMFNYTLSPCHCHSWQTVFQCVPSSCLGQTEFLIIRKKKTKSKIKNGAADSIVWPVVLKSRGSVHRKMRQELQLRPLSSMRDHPVSPTVPFQSNQRGEAGSRRNDIEGAQLFPTELGRGMPGEVYWVMRPPAHPPACLSPGRAAGIMGTPRLRS